MPQQGDDWTDSEEQTLQTHWDSMTAQEIAGMLPGRTLDAVYSKRHRMKENGEPQESAPSPSNTSASEPDVDIVFSADAEETAVIGVQHGGPRGAGPGRLSDYRVVAVSPEMKPHLDEAVEIIRSAYDGVDVSMGNVQTIPSSAIREQDEPERIIVLDRGSEHYGEIWE
jgi:predicted esterase YcpF (UPF0227 family)